MPTSVGSGWSRCISKPLESCEPLKIRLRPGSLRHPQFSCDITARWEVGARLIHPPQFILQPNAGASHRSFAPSSVNASIRDSLCLRHFHPLGSQIQEVGDALGEIFLQAVASPRAHR